MKRNIFEEKISCWSNTTRISANNITVSIGQFLNAGASYLDTPNMPTDINRLRHLYSTAMQTYPTDPARAASLFDEYKRQKMSMPLATMGGIFKNGGLKEDMISASKILTIDLDNTKPTDYHKYEGKEIPNIYVKDWNMLKWQLARLPFVAYAGLSIGGYGLFLLIPIEDESFYLDYWKCLEHLFKKHLKLVIDPQTKDITKPRFISYDPNPYINTQADVFRIKLPEKSTEVPVRRYSSTPSTATEEAVRKCVDEIECRGFDITSDYAEWIDIASALYNELGEAGKQYFERVSRFYPNANERDINYKWDKNKTRRKIGIGTFFEICARYGIRYKESLAQSKSKASAMVKPTREGKISPWSMAETIREPIPKAEPSESRIKYEYIPLSPKAYDYMGIYESIQLPPDFFTMRTDAAPF